MTTYDSTIPVEMTLERSGAAYTLNLVTGVTGAPALQPGDAVEANVTSQSQVRVTVNSSDVSTPIQGVIAIPISGAPSVTFTDNSGDWIADFPSPSSTAANQWEVKVAIDVTMAGDPALKIVGLDPIMIVRKTYA